MFRHVASALLLTAAVSSTSCSKSTTIAIAISNIPTDTGKIQATVLLDGKTSRVSPDYSFNSQSNGSALLTSIEIPFEFTNKQVSINLVAISNKSISCPLASWSGSLAALEKETYTISAPLEQLKDDPITSDLFSVIMKSSTDVWAAGSSGTLVNFDGCYWKKRTFLGGNALNSVGKLYRHDKVGMWALGNAGLVAAYDPTKDEWRRYDVAALFFQTGENGADVNWSSMTYIEGTTADIAIIGSSAGQGTPAVPVCYAMRGQPGANGYMFSRADTLCRVAMKPCPTPTTSPQITVSDCYYNPSTIASFPPDRVVTAGALNMIVSASPGIGYYPYTAFQTYDHQLQRTPTNQENRYYPPVSTSSPELFGSNGSIWGTSINDFWIASNRLYHVTNAGSSVFQTRLYNDNPQQFKITAIWGLSNQDFWTVAVNSNRIPQILHFSPRNNVPVSDANIGVANYSAGIDSLVATGFGGTSASDIWIVGYGGVRAYYNGSVFKIFR